MASRTLRGKAALATAAALGVAALGTGAGALVHEQIDASATCMNSGATVVTRGPRGECVGITDGSFLFGPAERHMTPADRAALTAVEKGFRTENQKVADRGPDYASVAYLLPIAAGRSGVESPKTMIEQLQGAYAAQVHDNATAAGGLQIKVLLVSDGLQGAGWATAVADIRRAVASQHVAAVAGLGVSIDSTMSAVQALTRGRSPIPVVGSSITSDAYNDIKNLVRVSPSNTDDVAKALDYIKPRFRRAVLVEDTNQDSYDHTLIGEFSRGFPDRTHVFVDHEPYDSGTPGAALAFPQIAADICTARGSAVLFAGRGKNLATLISALAGKCENQPVTIITGDDVVDMTMSRAVSAGLRKHVTLDYAGTANPDEWSGSAADVTAGRDGFDTFRQAFEQQHFSAASFADGSAMIGYDAALTSIAAIRLTRSLHPSPAEVAQVIGQLKGSRTVLGATGPIALSADYSGSAKTGSNPVQKAIPILQLEPSGSVRFLELDWSPRAAGELGQAGMVP